MEMFLYGNLVIDPYWDDLYNPKEKDKKIISKKK